MTHTAAIAIVDDDPSMLQSIGRILDLRGFTAHSYTSAEQFLLDERACETDCLVVDINLYGMSGIDLCYRLRESGKYIPIIFITASEDPKLLSKALETGCIGLLRKPFTASALFDAISRATISSKPADSHRLQ